MFGDFHSRLDSVKLEVAWIAVRAASKAMQDECAIVLSDEQLHKFADWLANNLQMELKP